MVFTDDDVRASSHWLREYRRGCLAYPTIAAFCGPIVPRFAVNPPEWLRTHQYAHLAFGDFQPILPEGLLPLRLLPFGSNFAVRAESIKGMKFREDLGPSTAGLLNDDTEFCKRLRGRGELFFFLPGAVVEHHIGSERLALDSLMERGFRYGRSTVIEENGHSSPHLEPRRLFELGMHMNILLGSSRDPECRRSF